MCCSRLPDMELVPMETQVNQANKTVTECSSSLFVSANNYFLSSPTCSTWRLGVCNVDVASCLSSTHHFLICWESIYYCHTIISFSCGKFPMKRSCTAFITAPLSRDADHPVTLHFKLIYCHTWPPLWSSGQSSWLQIRRPGFDSRHYQKKKCNGSGTGCTQPREYKLRSYLIEK
jgi:hypothetical protein